MIKTITYDRLIEFLSGHGMFEGIDLISILAYDRQQLIRYELSEIEKTLPTQESGLFILTLEGRVEVECQTEEECQVVGILREMATLYDYLENYETFDCHHYLGIDADFYDKRKQLTSWLLDQGYNCIAKVVAYTMLRDVAGQMDRFYYYPAQDYLTQVWCFECNCIIEKPLRSKIEPHLYTQTILKAIGKVESHIQEGIGMGLYIDQVILHDALFGRFMDHFDHQVLPVMRLVFGYMDMISSRAIKEQDNPLQPVEEQSEEYRTKLKEYIDDFGQWIKEVCDTRLPKDMIRHTQFSEGYLMATAERVMWGYWREEDEAI